MRATLEFLKKMRPKAFVLENVLGLSDKARPLEKSPLQVITKDLTDSGFFVHPLILNTSQYINVPRSRPGAARWCRSNTSTSMELCNSGM